MENVVQTGVRIVSATGFTKLGTRLGMVGAKNHRMIHNRHNCFVSLRHWIWILGFVGWLVSASFCAATTLAWDASTDPSTVGYRLCYGTASHTYTTTLDVGNTTTATVSNLQAGTTYFFAVTAYDSASLESAQSNEVSLTTSAPSNNASLASLVSSAGTLTPVFASGTTSYTASVANATTSITITPTAADGNATVKVNGVTVSSGSASGSISLNVGSNIITTVVTAQDGITTKTYTLTVTRAGATNADLASLIPSSGSLTPAFASGTTNYSVSVSNTTASMTVTPTVADSNAAVKVNEVSVISGSPSAAISLAVGANIITTVVTAQDGITTNTYTLTATRADVANVN